jgi:hypothetical protein
MFSNNYQPQNNMQSSAASSSSYSTSRNTNNQSNNYPSVQLQNVNVYSASNNNNNNNNNPSYYNSRTSANPTTNNGPNALFPDRDQLSGSQLYQTASPSNAALRNFAANRSVANDYAFQMSQNGPKAQQQSFGMTDNMFPDSRYGQMQQQSNYNNNNSRSITINNGTMNNVSNTFQNVSLESWQDLHQPY